MSVLSSEQIIDRLYRTNPKDAERIFIVPATKREDIKDASIDLRLGNYFIVNKAAKFSSLDALDDLTKRDIASCHETVFIPFDKTLILHPGNFVLGVTWQYIGLPNDIYAMVFARLTWGRAGLTVATAVSVHPRFCGCLTLELVNHGNAPVNLYPGTRIVQIVFMRTGANNANTSAHSKYCGLIQPDISRLHDERDELKKWHEIGKRSSTFQ